MKDMAKKKEVPPETNDDTLKWAAWNGIGSAARKGSALELTRMKETEVSQD